MATFSRRAVKLVAAASVVPALGLPAALQLKPVFAEDKAEDSSKRSIYRACDLPLDDHTEKEELDPPCEVYPRNAVEKNIGVARKTLFDMGSAFMEQCELISDKFNIGVEHTKASVEYIQNNPGELPRVALICVAGMGGVVLGYRGGILRKLVYSSIAVGSTAALCYPKTTLELSETVSDEMSSLWKEVGGKDLVDKYWPFGEEKADVKVEPSSVPAPELTQAVVKSSEVKKDEGQSNPKDKDMYSTRGS